MAQCRVKFALNIASLLKQSWHGERSLDYATGISYIVAQIICSCAVVVALHSAGNRWQHDRHIYHWQLVGQVYYLLNNRLVLLAASKYADQRFVSGLTHAVSEKAIAGRARKAARAEQKEEEEAAALEAEEEAKWQQGAKGKTAADERREKAEKRLAKRNKLAEITALDEKGSQVPVKPAMRNRGDYPDPSNRSLKLAAIIFELDECKVVLTAPSIDAAVKSVKGLAVRYRGYPLYHEKLDSRVSKAFKEFEGREGVNVKERFPSLSSWKRDAILWGEFKQSPCNPANNYLSSADARTEEKMKMIEEKKKELEWEHECITRAVVQWYRMFW